MRTLTISEKLKKVEFCPLCKQTGRRLLYVLKQTQVYRCIACQLSYLDPCLDAEAMAAIYQSSETLKECNSFHDGYYEYGNLDTPSQTLREFTQSIKLLEKGIPQTSLRNIFEIGYGNGMFLALAAQRGWRVDGIDTSAANATIANAKFGLSLKTGFFSRSNLPPWQPQVIAMLDLIEHLSDPHILLKEIHEVLPADGLLLIATPNEDSFLRSISDFVYKISGQRVKTGIEKIYFLEHATYFNFGTLKHLIQQNGFQVLDHFYSSTDIEKYHFNFLEKLLGKTIVFFQKIFRRENRLIMIVRKL